jgi:hypothetical protein
MAAGIALILSSQMLAAGQLLIDQGWAYGRLRLSPLKVVGCEGLLGFVLTVGAWLGTSGRVYAGLASLCVQFWCRLQAVQQQLCVVALASFWPRRCLLLGSC